MNHKKTLMFKLTEGFLILNNKNYSGMITVSIT